HERLQRGLESSKPFRRCWLLPGLVILAAVDYEIKVLMRFEPIIAIRINGVPQKNIRKRPLCHLTCNNIRSVERQLRLEQRRAHQSLISDQGRVRGDDDVVTRHVITVGAYGTRIV